MTETGDGDLVGSEAVQLRPPLLADEWNRYFDLRWRVLRAPWRQPRGSERDDREDSSRHLALWREDGHPVAVGRIHLVTSAEAQVRYMAVEPNCSGRGFGGQILAGLESAARELGATEVVLNSREAAQRFYQRHGYSVVGPADTMFGEIPHVRMQKRLLPVGKRLT